MLSRQIYRLCDTAALHEFSISVMRTLTGHKSSIRSLDFHPYGDYAASGSLDCNIKVRNS